MRYIKGMTNYKNMYKVWKNTSERNTSKILMTKKKVMPIIIIKK